MCEIGQEFGRLFKQQLDKREITPGDKGDCNREDRKVMTAVYLVGPSGGGKSTLCKALIASDARFLSVSLDKEVKRIAPGFEIHNPEDWDIRWIYCKQALQELSKRATPNQIYLIDTGAGALQTAEGRVYFIERSSHMICLSGQPAVIYKRNCDKFISQNRSPRSFDDFYKDEFSPSRQCVYDAARVTIDTTIVDKKTALGDLRKSVELILAESGDRK